VLFSKDQKVLATVDPVESVFTEGTVVDTKWISGTYFYAVSFIEAITGRETLDEQVTFELAVRNGEAGWYSQERLNLPAPMRFCPECEEEDYFLIDDYLCGFCRDRSGF
jgi:hypothetical protein